MSGGLGAVHMIYRGSLTSGTLLKPRHHEIELVLFYCLNPKRSDPVQLASPQASLNMVWLFIYRNNHTSGMR